MSALIVRQSWDDFRIVRAIAHTRALVPAVGMLGLNGLTIARHLAKVEEVLSVVLFDQCRTGYVATAQGEEIFALAERVAGHLVRPT